MFPKRLNSYRPVFLLARNNDIRPFSSSSSSSSNDNKDDKNKRITTIKSIKSQKSTVNKDKLIKNEEKLKSLEKNVEKLKSISPNSNETLNKTTGKPRLHVRQSARSINDKNVKIDEDVEPMEVLARGLDKRLVEAARRVANRMPKHSARQTERQLLDSIKEQQKETSEAAKKMISAKEDWKESISYKILSGNRPAPKIGQDDSSLGTTSKVSRVKMPKDFDFESESKPMRKRQISLFSNECLSIFDPKGIYLNENHNEMWENLSKRELNKFLERPSKNFFDEMIKWTDEGKLWKYPIDNEQGLEHEASIPFYDHVLLDHLLDEFPQTGPVRQFMELVILGLSQNPYITVERKRKTIKFYRNFFEEKNLLKDLE